MDENMSDDDNREDPSDGRENPKRMKTEGGSLEESSSSSNSTEQESSRVLDNILNVNSTSSASNGTSGTDSGFPRTRMSANRNYRHRSSSDPVLDNASSSEVVAAENPVEETEDEDERLANFFNYSSPGSSDSTVIHDTDTESDEEDHPVMKKEKPKHNWFVVPEIVNRQIGFSSKLKSNDLFQRRCYGSLHCVQRLELMYKLEEHEGCVNSLDFHPNGDLLASGSDDCKVVVWDWKIGKCLLKYDSKHRVNVFQSKFLNLSGDLHIATCAKDGHVRVAQVSPDDGVRDNRKLGSHKGPCHKLAVLAEQPHVILSAGEDGLVLSHDVRKNKPERIVTLDNDQEIALYSIHANPLKTMEFCVSGRDSLVRVYDQRKSGRPLATYHPFENGEPKNSFSGPHITCAVYNHDGTEILASYNDADVYLFDVTGRPGEFKHRYQGHRNSATIKGVNFFGPKSEYIVSGSDCGNVYFWDKNTEAIVQWMLADDNGVVNVLEPHPQLPFICTSGLDWDVKVWVPSCESEPEMLGLSDTVRNNAKDMTNLMGTADINESQMLWMLWRHMRSTNRARRDVTADDDNILFHINTMSGSSTSSMSSPSDSQSNSDDNDIDGPTGCSTS
ncbi:unnamed protein product [Phaedon cochleariae]|uniref:DDB1-and CUL4-associated factor 8 n=1 Tax=Phaedon cochleariae TaxID=80249 RepID=A0A9P0DST1_PHACE|nr:unnamed protein product [Phaedon cochleariae]